MTFRLWKITRFCLGPMKESAMIPLLIVLGLALAFWMTRPEPIHVLSDDEAAIIIADLQRPEMGPLLGTPTVIDGQRLAVDGYAIRLANIVVHSDDGARHMTDIIGDHLVRCTVIGHDPAGFGVATCSTLSDADIAAKLVHRGQASVMENPDYAVIEAGAQQMSVGIW